AGELAFSSFGPRVRSGSTQDEKFGDFAEARSAVVVRRKFSDGFRCKFVGDLMRAFESVDGRIRRLLLREVFSRRFAEGGGGFFHVKDVIGHLESPADGLAKAAQARHILGTCSGTQRPGSDRRS